MQVSVWLSQDLGDVEMKKIIGRILKAKKARNVERREREAGLTLEEVRHRRVARWTRNVTLMDKTLIIFPIYLADTEHWLLAVAVQGAEPLVMMLPPPLTKTEIQAPGTRPWAQTSLSLQRSGQAMICELK